MQTFEDKPEVQLSKEGVRDIDWDGYIHSEKGKMADKNIVRLMNAMNYVEQSKTQYWRIRLDTSDRDASHAIGAMLAIKLHMADKQVDYETPWGIPHSGDYDLDALFQWVDSISK